jgi:DNA-binding CsgD family transcriptional regulator
LWSQLLESAPGSSFGLFNPLRPEAHQRNRAFGLGPLNAALAPNSDAQARLRPEKRSDPEPLVRVYRAAGVIADHHLRFLACSGPILSGYLNFWRAAPFDAREEQLLQQLGRALCDRLRLEEAAASGRASAVACETLLEAWAAPAGIIDAQGNTVFGNAVVRQQPTGFGEVAQVVRKGLHPPGWQSQRLRLPGVAREYWLLTAAPRPGKTGALERNARRWALTARESHLLRLLVATGCSNRELATVLGIATRTVEVHMGHLLAKAGCASRAGLVAAAST